ncbi:MULTISPECIES: TraB/GumN family protein [Hyphomonas]|uniref:TraB/GumN family protein n=1 Tax=Hyphomonas adhaerens TaxID=81029 RepID=A0A3B9GSY1_9PROT|nr:MULTISPECIES: TraB/GumN family protein [Hyphomonas]MBB41768.1 TraB/GumN family protein [Hyphomonas sp.]HAE25565.1 TraB/GumN family protein [Hyphomonas adhaerens]
MKRTGWAATAAAAMVLALAGCGGSGTVEDKPDASPAAERAAREARQDALYDAALAAAEASHGSGEPAVWTLADEDTTIRIMGTVHFLRPELDWRSDEIDTALAEADTLVFEADVSSPEAAGEMMDFVSTHALFTDGRQLTSLLDEGETAELKAALDYLGFPLGAMETFRPWYAAVNLSVLQMQKDGFDPSAGVEQVLEREGKAAGKDFAYLETIEEQLGRFANLPDDEQVDFLISSAESVEEGSEMLDVLVDEWEDGDVAGLAALMSNPEMMGSEAIYDALLKERNEDWVPKIEAMLDAPGTVLIAVGAGHLAGEDSVIELLRADGYEVEGP